MGDNLGQQLTFLVTEAAESIVDQSVEKLDCTVHRSRNLRGKVYGAKWSVELIGKPRDTAYKYRRGKLADALVNRSTAELKRRLALSEDETEIQEKIKFAKYNIIPCFCGDHSKCKEQSLVCRGGRRKTPTHLPYDSFINPTESDKVTMQELIEKYLGEASVHSLRTGLDTNKVESLHHRTLKVLPKTKLIKRNFNGLNNSAMHSDTFGTGASVAMVNAHRGAENKGPEAVTFMKNNDKKDSSDCYRRRLPSARASRKRRRWHSLNMKKFSTLSIK